MSTAEPTYDLPYAARFSDDCLRTFEDPGTGLPTGFPRIHIISSGITSGAPARIVLSVTDDSSEVNDHDSLPLWRIIEESAVFGAFDLFAAVLFRSKPHIPLTERFRSSVEDINEIAAVLSLNTSQLGKVLGVSRTIIYAWRNGEKKPTQESIRSRIRELAALASYWKSISNRPVGDGLDYCSENSGLTLLDLFSQVPLNYPAARQHLDHLAKHLASYWSDSDTLLENIRSVNWKPMPDRFQNGILRTGGTLPNRDKPDCEE